MTLGMELPTCLHNFLLLQYHSANLERSRCQVLYKHSMGLISFNVRKPQRLVWICRQADLPGGLGVCPTSDLTCGGVGVPAQAFDLKSTHP